MGSSKYTITLEWENGGIFEMKSQKDEEAAIIVLEVQENAHYGDIRPHIEGICETFFEKKLKEIGDEMVS